MDVLEAIRTTRSMRRLDPGRDVSDEDLVTMIDAATRAPTGGNSQPVRWLVVRDPELRRRVGDVYRTQARMRLVAYEQDAKTNPEVARMLRSARHLAEHMGEAPALLIPCAKAERARAGSSVFPAVQNLMLAARALGLHDPDDHSPRRRRHGTRHPGHPRRRADLRHHPGRLPARSLERGSKAAGLRGRLLGRLAADPPRRQSQLSPNRQHDLYHLAVR